MNRNYVLTIFLLPIACSCIAQENSIDRIVTQADMPRIPPTEPADVLDTFRLAQGFRLELVASEPMVGDPVDACFDEYGRMFVAEMHGYPFSQEPTKLNPKGGGRKDAGIIRMLEDTDGDGQIDNSVVFADGISWPTSVCCYDGGVYVVAPKYLYYFKDTDGDGKADVRRKVLEGFGRGNVQAVTNGLRWTLDNRICFAAGRNPTALRQGGEPLSLVGGADLSFNPKVERFMRVTGGQQFGHSIDDWGVRFVCSNSNHIQQVVYPTRYLARNPYLTESALIRNIATDGASAQVFRISPPEPWRIVRQKWRAADKGYRLVINSDGGWEFVPLDPSVKKGAVPTEYPVGYFTSATGITIYRGNAYPQKYQGNAFVGDVGGNLVHRKTVNADGIVYTADRADEGEEFLACSDNWFRPVNFVNAPDGTLYVLDMCRETVEHPHSIPEEIKKFLYLTSGDDRGRIYRLLSPNTQLNQVVRIGDLDNEQLVKQLGSANGWNRTTAQRIIWERQDEDCVPFLEQFLESTSSPMGRMHTLYCLDGLGRLNEKHLRIGLQDSHPRVRGHAIRLAEGHLRSNPAFVSELVKLCEDENVHVQFQLAFTLGESSRAEAIDGLLTLARKADRNRELQTAILSASPGILSKLAVRITKAKSLDGYEQLLGRYAVMASSNKAPDHTVALLSAVIKEEVAPATKLAVLKAIGQGLRRRGSTLQKFLSGSEVAKSTRDSIYALFQRTKQQAFDETLPLQVRESSLRLIEFADLRDSVDEFSLFLTPQTPRLLQRAAISTLSKQQGPVSHVLLGGWKGYTPGIRRDVVDAMLVKTGRIDQLLAAIDKGIIKRKDIERDTKQVLMLHPNTVIKLKSKRVFGAEVDSDRSKVVQDFQEVLRLSGDKSRGKEVFKRKCAVCHQVGGMGYQVAPSLSSVKNKSEADLLIAILDPNREAQPNFNTYTIQTLDGRVLHGMIGSETATSISLRRAEGKEDVVLRNNIEQIAATGVSLMPEGLEKDLTRQELADIIAFVKSIE